MWSTELSRGCPDLQRPRVWAGQREHEATNTAQSFSMVNALSGEEAPAVVRATPAALLAAPLGSLAELGGVHDVVSGGRYGSRQSG